VYYTEYALIYCPEYLFNIVTVFAHFALMCFICGFQHILCSKITPVNEFYLQYTFLQLAYITTILLQDLFHQDNFQIIFTVKDPSMLDIDPGH